jgi:hypothetical protein
MCDKLDQLKRRVQREIETAPLGSWQHSRLEEACNSAYMAGMRNVMIWINNIEIGIPQK